MSVTYISNREKPEELNKNYVNMITLKKAGI